MRARFLLDIKIEISRNALDEDISVAGRLFKENVIRDERVVYER